MQLEWAVFAKAAELGDGSVHLLGAGIDSIDSDNFPDLLTCAVAMKLCLEPAEAGQEHSVSVSFGLEGSGERVQTHGDFVAPQEREDLPNTIFLVFNFIGTELQGPGTYRAIITRDEIRDGTVAEAELGTLTLRVRATE